MSGEAEGATASETLRQKDRATSSGTLESACRVLRQATEGVSAAYRCVSLRSDDRGGMVEGPDFRALPSRAGTCR
jgi:hypothetical protein